MGRAALAGTGFALGAAACAGLANVVGKHAFLGGQGPIALVAAAYVLACFVLSPDLLRFRLAERGDVLPLVVSAAFGVVLAPLSLFVGLNLTTAVTGSLLVNLETLFTGILAAVFLRERLRAPEAAALAAVFAGGLVVALGPELVRGERVVGDSLLGAGLVALAALSWSVDSTINTRLVARYPLRPLLAVKCLVGALALPLIAWLAEGTALPASFAWPHVAFIGLVGVVASMLLFFGGLRSVGATRTLVLFATAGLWGAVGGRVFLGEALTLAHLAGAALMMVGIAAFARSSHQETLNAPALG